jgi:hypothetical protein
MSDPILSIKHGGEYKGRGTQYCRYFVGKPIALCHWFLCSGGFGYLPCSDFEKCMENVVHGKRETSKKNDSL